MKSINEGKKYQNLVNKINQNNRRCKIILITHFYLLKICKLIFLFLFVKSNAKEYE